jgi:tetratricopeptide (TPR) repeat protein
MSSLSRWCVWLAAALLLSACAGGGARTLDPLGALAAVAAVPEAEGPWRALVEGRGEEALEGFRAAAEASPAGAARARLRFGHGEAAWLAGRYEEAAAAHVEAVREDPGGPLVGWSLLRLLELRGLAPNAQEALSPAVDAVLGAGERPELWARAQARTLGEWIAREEWEGSEAAEPFDGGAWGQPTRWRVVGPVSVYPNLETFADAPSAPEQDAVMADSYALLGFSRRAEALEVRSDQARWRAGISGVYVAEAWVELSEERVVDLSVFAEGNAAVRVDGEEVWRRDERGEYAPLSAPVEGLRLTAGWHRVQVRFGYVRGYKEQFGVRFLPRGGGALRTAARPPEGFVAGRLLSRGRSGSWMGEGFAASALSGRPLSLVLAATRATSVSDEGAAWGALEGLSGEVKGEGLRGLLEAFAWSGRWSAPGEIRSRETLAALRRAVEGDAGGGRARLWLLGLLRRQERREDAAALVESLLEASPDQAAVWLEASIYYGWRGLHEREEAALSRAVSLDPGSCDAKARLYEAWRGRDYTPGEAALPGGWGRCDGLRRRVARDRWRPGEGVEGYLFHVKRQVARSPQDAEAWGELVEVTRDLQDAGAALEVLARGRAAAPEDAGLALLEADLRLERGDVEGARGVLEAALARHGGSAGLHQRLALLGGALPLEELRVDGRAAIAAAEADPDKPLNSAAFYALDYMARRYFEDGSHVDLIHLVTGVRSKEGINQRGEVSFPGGALPLMVRTIKRDGRVLEPQAQEGKGSISLEGLEPGDYIEHAWLDFSGPVVTQQGATVGADFYFRMDDIASARSEFIVEVPASWDPQFVAQNLPPAAEISTHGPWRRYRFLRTGSSEPRPEPDAVPKEEYLPHVQLLHRYGWQDAHRFYQDQLAGGPRPQPRAEAPRRRGRRGGAREEEKR